MRALPTAQPFWEVAFAQGMGKVRTATPEKGSNHSLDAIGIEPEKVLEK
jgi:hypothetical protein